jgi:outer membrane protein TolC
VREHGGNSAGRATAFDGGAHPDMSRSIHLKMKAIPRKVANMVLRSLGLIALAAATLPAQFNTFPAVNYFKEQWTKPPMRVEIEPVGRLDDFVVSGKLQLSLRSYIELVMANNPDVNLQKLAVYEQQNLIDAAYSPFDPNLDLSFNANRSTTQSTDVLQGAAVRSRLTQNAGITYEQTFDTGTRYTVGFLGVRSGDNSSFTSFNPSLTHRFQVGFTQPLLRDRGRYIQRIPIMVAQSRLDVTEAEVREQVINLLVQAENAYWNVVESRENLNVARNNLDLRLAFLERSRRELELGAISPLDIYQPEQQFASAQVAVTQTQYRLEQAEDVVRRWIGADLDPDIRNVAIELSEAADPPASAPVLDREEQVVRALQLRPEVEQRRRLLEIDDLNIRASTNELRPELNLTGNYTSAGQAGVFFERSLTDDAPAPPPTPLGWTTSLDQIFQFRFPTYSMGLTLNLPLRNRRAAADLANSSIQKKRDLYQLRSQEQRIRQEVLNAVAGVELAKAALEQATVARDFAQKRVDAEQKKYDLGVQVAFFVLEAQTDLAAANADVVAQSIAYRRSMLDLLQATGELLEARGVSIQYD